MVLSWRSRGTRERERESVCFALRGARESGVSECVRVCERLGEVFIVMENREV